MSSFIRNLQRKRLRQVRFDTDADGNQIRVEHEPKPQHTIMLANGGYVTVRYTKGPRLVSAARLPAQGRVAAIQQPGAARTEERSFSDAVDRMQARSAAEQRITTLVNAPVHAITRQIRRHAVRTGRALPPLIAADKPKRVRKPRAAA